MHKMRALVLPDPKAKQLAAVSLILFAQLLPLAAATTCAASSSRSWCVAVLGRVMWEDVGECGIGVESEKRTEERREKSDRIFVRRTSCISKNLYRLSKKLARFQN